MAGSAKKFCQRSNFLKNNKNNAGIFKNLSFFSCLPDTAEDPYSGKEEGPNGEGPAHAQNYDTKQQTHYFQAML